jgi:hypothetical protein
MLGGGKMGFIRAFLDASNIVQEERDQAEAEGFAKGLALSEARGQAAVARRFLRLFLRKLLPELESLAEINAVSSVAALEAIAESVLDASGADSVRAAILAAAKPN